MSYEYIDASVGLRFSLELLKKYEESGLLQALLPRLPGLTGKSHVSITVLRGVVTSCQARDQSGKPQTIDLNLLLKLDRDRGPFEWSLSPLPQQEKSSQKNKLPAEDSYPQLHKQQEYITPNSPIPYIIARLDINQLTSWSPEQKRLLYTLYSLIDGKNTIESITNFLALPPETVEEGLKVLIALHVIIIPS